MPFNTLLLTCLVPGTSLSESGVRISIQRQSDETILFFPIDDQSHPDCGLRQSLKMTGKSCDLVIFYTRKNKRVLCFVELKSTDLPTASKQIINTYQHLQQALRRSLPVEFFSQIEWKACLRQHRSASTNKIELGQVKKDLEGIFGPNNISVTRKRDVGRFVRE